MTALLRAIKHKIPAPSGAQGDRRQLGCMVTPRPGDGIDHASHAVAVLTGPRTSIARLYRDRSWQRRSRSQNAIDTAIEGECATEIQGAKGRTSYKVRLPQWR
jgi:hypothetical protein